MTNPIIGYKNIYRDGGTLSASTDPAATPKENATDWRLEDYWQPTAATSHTLDIDAGAAVSADYFAFYSSDLFAEAGAQVELFSGSSSPATTSRGTISPTTRGPKLATFTSASARYWRLTFSTTGSFAPKIQIANIGAQLELQRGLRPGFAPPALGPRNIPGTNISESGLFLGRSLAVAPVAFRIPLTLLTPAWIRANWPALLTHIEQYPFFIMPEPDSYTDEIAIAWTARRPGVPEYSHSNFMRVNLDLKAFV